MHGIWNETTSIADDHHKSTYHSPQYRGFSYKMFILRWHKTLQVITTFQIIPNILFSLFLTLLWSDIFAHPRDSPTTVLSSVGNISTALRDFVRARWRPLNWKTHVRKQHNTMQVISKRKKARYEFCFHNSKIKIYVKNIPACLFSFFCALLTSCCSLCVAHLSLKFHEFHSFCTFCLTWTRELKNSRIVGGIVWEMRNVTQQRESHEGKKNHLIIRFALTRKKKFLYTKNTTIWKNRRWKEEANLKLMLWLMREMPTVFYSFFSSSSSHMCIS